ncbi:hypothetical protein BDR06DRAFT_969944 [Suillus hirtellus]|nr:hypothetical protein BDR06DRAFT_969944 [Suillus hirtellus]
MLSRCIHFTPPLNATQPHTVATAGESHSVQMQQAHQEWWGNFVPIADWEPLKICKSKFDRMKIQNYRISPEIDKPRDPECPYDRAFAGTNDTVGKLTAMFNEEWVSKEQAATPADTNINMDVGSVNLEASYDLGWDSAPDGGDYDLGWDSAPNGNDVPSVHLILTMRTPLSLTTLLVLLQTSLGLDQGILLDLASCEKTSHYSITSTEFYLLLKLPLDAIHLIFLYWNSIDIDEVYDLGWNDTATMDCMEDRHVQSDLIPLSSSSNSVGDEDSDASAGVMSSNAQLGASNHTPDVLHQAEAALAHAFWRLNAMGHIDDDKQMHCIVQTTVDGLGRSYAPSRVRRANSWLFGTYSEARNRVTEVGEDILSIT